MLDPRDHDQERLLDESNGDAIEQMQQSDATPLRQTEQEHRRLCRRLYLSHALSTWNSRSFEFGAFLFLANIYPNTLLPASVYALARAASAAIFSPWLGSYIDSADRLRAVRLSILGQRIPVVLSCAGFLILLAYSKSAETPLWKAVSLTLLSILACVEKLSAVLNTISVERDWVVVVAAADEVRLATMNAQMRRIDLFCKLAGPLAISLVDSYTTKAAVLATATMSGVSVMIEYLAIARVYTAVPALRTPKSITGLAANHDTSTLEKRVLSGVSVLLVYIRHPAFLPSFALALLYLTALSFSGQFITYLLAQGLGSATVAVLRGLAAVSELSATWLGPWLHARIGAVRAGIWFLNAELIFIALSCALLWLPGTSTHGMTAIFALVAAVILSRMGLWGFDLSAQLIIQDEVEPDMRGTFSCLEASFQNIFEMLAFASTVIFPRPDQFRIPAAISAAAVAMAALLYALFVRHRRGHLFHSSKCLDRHDRPKPEDRGWQSIATEEPHNAEELPQDR